MGLMLQKSEVHSQVFLKMRPMEQFDLPCVTATKIEFGEIGPCCGTARPYSCSIRWRDQPSER
jgi:hypothetical protein